MRIKLTSGMIHEGLIFSIEELSAAARSKLTTGTKDGKLWLDMITHFLKEHITEK